MDRTATVTDAKFRPETDGGQPKIQLRTTIELSTDMSESIAKLRSFSFVLAVPDLKRSASYFHDALGFRLEWPEGSGWQLVSRGDVRIMIGHCPDAMLPSATGDHSYFGYLNVDDADAFHSELVNRGAIILQPPTDRAHGMREFVIGTPDGHRMMVGQELSAAN
ncbi:VOC family protein [Pollutimonas bauzanensis]|uniref:Uncharacterized conserved protein PhnB, glyoxalase superfamily n=1 Tax=Pollutimonas bauzanensis TaxID=658167 RepID=A0A1M5UJH4_9BURK|nr:VOC family protein [Pollutimonas bauzanensis]SHH63222.1 Uncharacterized conserved protein PhnB, glyoxalase superfamily [Pollutimonas bauzanensis]